MGYLSNGAYMVAWGVVARDARMSTFPSGKNVTNFSLSYDAKKVDGHWKNAFMNVDAWGELGRYASLLEKGDHVLVCGELKPDEFASKKKGVEVKKLVCADGQGIVMCQPVSENPLVNSFTGRDGYEETDEPTPFDDDGPV